MKTISYIILLCLTLLFSCSKDKEPQLSGKATIDNQLYLNKEFNYYYAVGFNFAAAKKVTTELGNICDITLANDGTLDNLILQTGNYMNSFYKAGEYSDALSAEAAFNNLKEVNADDWEEWAFDIKENQIWVYKTLTENYVKLRIISIISEMRNGSTYAECTFEWVYQPDGTSTFPGK